MAGDPREIRRCVRALGLTRRGLAAACALAVVLGGCGGGSHPKASHSNTTGSTSTTTAAGTSKPVASGYYTAPWTNGPNSYKVSIYDLRRDGPFLVLDFGVRCLNPSQGCQIDRAFAPGQYLTPRDMVADNGKPSGIGLVDPADLKEYLTVRDNQDNPYTTSFSFGASGGIQDSNTHLEWVRYPMPPPAVSALDVVFPEGNLVIPHVPITSGSPPTAGGQTVADKPATFAQAPNSTNTSGLTLPVENLTATSGNPTGSDSESPGKAQITLHTDVLFKFGKSNLTPKAKTVLSSVAKQIKSRARGTVQVTGYTDSIGSDSVNIPLSRARAAAVVNELGPLTPGISYSASGKGSADPVAPNSKPDGSDNPAGRALNRRVTIAFAAAPVRPVPPPQTSAPSASAAAGQGSMTFAAAQSSGKDTYRVSNATLYRDQDLMILTMTLTCAHSAQPNGCDPALELSGTPTVPPQPLFAEGPSSNDPAAANSLSGFYLTDPATGAEYIPLVRGDAIPLTTALNIDFLHPSDSYRVWAYFSSPSSTPSSLTLVSPEGTARLSGVTVTGNVTPQSPVP
jgi:outer membrane protein OmpA-like peptidoglycan-associated protein